MSYIIDVESYVNSLDLYDRNPYNHIVQDNLRSKIKSVTFNSAKTVKDFFSKTETKVSALVSYWAVEATITAFGVYAFLKLGMITPVILSLLLLAYITYATFGVIGEVVK